jgi:hypothetical protein
MVRFGGIDSSSRIPQRRKQRRKGTIRIPELKVQNIIIALVILLILRSFMIQHDGRQGREEGLQELKEVRRRSIRDSSPKRNKKGHSESSDVQNVWSFSICCIGLAFASHWKSN